MIRGALRRFLERIGLLERRRGNQAVWAAVDRGAVQQAELPTAHGKVKSATLSATIRRADGRIEDLGVISRTRGR